jgi:hypothetical protein
MATGVPAAARSPARLIDAESAAARVGTLEREMLEHARSVVASIPDDLVRAVHEPAEAEAVIYALLLVSDSARRQRQLDRLSAHADGHLDALLAEMGRALRLLRETGEEHRLPIVDLALPALRRISDRQYRNFLVNVETLASGEGELRLFEFTLRRILARHLAPHFDRPEPSRVAYYSLKGLVPEVSTLLSSLAWIGGNERAADAFSAGRARLDPRLGIEFLQVDRCSLDDVDDALRRFAQVAHRHKRRLIEAVVLCVAYDRRVTIEEAELLRAICDALDSPMPPFLPGSLAA